MNGTKYACSLQRNKKTKRKQRKLTKWHFLQVSQHDISKMRKWTKKQRKQMNNLLFSKCYVFLLFPFCLAHLNFSKNIVFRANKNANKH